MSNGSNKNHTSRLTKNSQTKYASHNQSKQTQVVKKMKPKEKTHKCFLLFSVVIFIIILISTVFGDLVQIYKNKNSIKELSDRKVLLLEEEASLNSEVVKLQDPEYKARYAREKYFYTKDGEKILTIVESSDEVKQEDTKESEDSTDKVEKEEANDSESSDNNGE